MLNVYKIMALVKRGSLNRPLTIGELDGNFEHIINLIGTQSNNQVSGLSSVLSIGNTSSTGIYISNTFSTINLGIDNAILFNLNDSDDNTVDISAEINEISLNVSSLFSSSYLSISSNIIEGSVNSFGLSPSTINSFKIDNNGVGIKTGLYFSYFKNDLSNSTYVYQLPRKNGEIALKVDSLTVVIDTNLLGGLTYSILGNDFTTVPDIYIDDPGTVVIGNMVLNSNTFLSVNKTTSGEVSARVDNTNVVINTRSSSGVNQNENTRIYFKLTNYNSSGGYIFDSMSVGSSQEEA